MAKAFNLTAQINLQGPIGLKPIVSQIKKEFAGIKTNLNLNIDPNAAKKVATITSGVQNLSKALDQATISVSNLNAGFGSLGSTLGNIKSATSTLDGGFNKVATSARSTAKASKQAATDMEAFGKASALALKRLAAFSVVSTSIYGLVNSVNSAISEFVVFDRELIRLSQVTNNNIGQFGQLSSQVQDISNEVSRLSTTLGVSSQDLIKVASTLAQAGLSASETKVALEALAKSSLAPSFDDISQTTEGAIAALRQFGLSASDLEGTLGSINAVAAAFAVESDDIIKAIQRTGGVFAASSRGINTSTQSLNEFIAIFTSVRATTRESAETIATGLRTIFTRIQRSSTIDRLKEYGVTLTDLEGKFVGPFEAVKRLSAGLSVIDPRDLRFSEIVEELGGFRQIGKVIPLIQQFATAEQALAVANQGTTSLTKDTELALLSLGNQFARTREEFLSLIREFANTTTLKGLTTGTLALTRGFISVVGALKPLLPLITTLATIQIGKKAQEFAKGFGGQLFSSGQVSTGTTGGTSVTGARNTAPNIGSANTTALIALTRSIDNLNNTIKASSITGRKGFATGGLVGGTGNRDTVPAMLTPGEFVIRKKAVESIGVGNLENMNKYATGGPVQQKGSDLIRLYPSLSNKISPEDNFKAYVEPKPITSKNISLVGNMIKNKKQNNNLETWRNFELSLSKAYGLAYDTTPGAYLDFPKKPGDAKFLKSGNTNRSDDPRGNNNETMLAKLVGAGLYKNNKNNNITAYFPENPKQIERIVEDYTSGKNKDRQQYGIFKFANGGSPKDTVPALLTPGEFVIRKEAAKKIGSATLHKMNNADKLQGYNKGGFVGGVKVQEFADGGDVEAAIQRILMSLEPIVQQAERAAYQSARNPEFTGRKGQMTRPGATAQEALTLARQTASQVAKEAAKSAKATISARTGTDYTSTEAASEKRLVDAALKRMLRAIESGKDPSVKGETTKRRQSGIMQREAGTINPAIGTIDKTPELTKTTDEATEAIDKNKDAVEGMTLSVTDFALLTSNAILPQLQQFADSLKITDSALGAAASKAVETAGSFALSASLGLKAVGASNKQVAIGTGLALGGGAIGGGLEGFATKSLEKAILENNKSLNNFDSILRQVNEAPTEQLRLEATAELENSFRKLTISIENSQSAISSLETLQNVGTAFTNATNTIIGLGTATLAATQAINAAKISAAASAAAAGTVSTGLTSIGTTAAIVGGTLLKFTGWIGLVITVGSALYQVFAALSKTSTSATENLGKYAQKLKELTTNSNDFNLANQRYTTEVLKQFAELRKNTTPEDLKKLLGQTQKVSTEGQVGSIGIVANLNQFNLLLDQFIREQFRAQGLLIQNEQSIQDFFNSLGDAGKELAKEIIVESTGGLERRQLNQPLSKFETSMFIRARKEGDANLSDEVITNEMKTLGRTTEGLAKMRAVIEANLGSWNLAKQSADLLAASMRQQQIAVLNLTDVLNRLGAGLERVNVDTSNSFDDILYNFKRSTENNVPVREDVTASRSAQVLKNISAYSTKELSSAIDQALSTLNLNRTNFVETRFQDAQSIKDAVLAFQKVQTEVPLALREFAQIQQTKPGESIDLKKLLQPIFKPLNLETEVTDTILTELESSIRKNTTGEGTLEIEQVIGRFKELSKNLDVNKLALENLTKAQENQAEQNKRLAEIANTLSATYIKMNELTIQSAQLSAETALDIQRITGQIPSLNQLNEPFNAAIRSLTSSIGSSFDPKVISQAITDQQQQLKQTRLNNGQDTQAVAILESNINNLQKALNMLGSKNDRLINALDNLRQVEEERKGVGDLFEEMIKASRDPIARMDIEATIDAAQRVRAGSTNINDVVRVLEKYIPMLAKTGPQGQEQAQALRNQIFARGAAQGTIENLLAGNLKNALGGLGLVNLFAGGKTEQAQNIVLSEEQKIQEAIKEIRLRLLAEQEQLNNGIIQVNDTFRQKMSELLPNITIEMKNFLDGIKQLNQEKTAVKLPEIKMDIGNSKDILKKILDKFPSFPGPGLVLPPVTTKEITSAKSESDIVTLANKLLPVVERMGRSSDVIQLRSMIEQAIQQQKQITSNPQLLGITNPSRQSLLNQQTPSRTQPRFGVRDVTNEPDFNVQRPVGGGAFNIPPEVLTSKNTAQVANVTTKTKLDFDYNDFITKFSTAFDTETGKFRNVIKDLSLAFPALQAPIDTFNKSVNKLIDGLNSINDNGGIKGPNIPEKVTINVVFDEDLTIDTSRINNNDLLNQIGVVTKDAINARLAELKLTGR